MICENFVDYGLFLRYALSVLTIFVLSKTMHNPFVRKHILLILPVVLTVLDGIDNIFTNLKGIRYCNRRIYYHFYDKVADSLSYLLVLSLFRLDSNILYFALYRIIGVILVRLTKNMNWLILFFDFVKEYMVYLFFFKGNNAYLPILMFAKICFEFLIHYVRHGKDYVKEELDV